MSISPATAATATRNTSTQPAAAVTEHVFEIKFRKGGKTTIRAAYTQHGATAAHAATASASSSDTPVVLKDADGQIVFLAPSSVIRSVTRKGRHPAGTAL